MSAEVSVSVLSSSSAGEKEHKNKGVHVSLSSTDRRSSVSFNLQELFGLAKNAIDSGGLFSDTFDCGNHSNEKDVIPPPPFVVFTVNVCALLFANVV